MQEITKAERKAHNRMVRERELTRPFRKGVYGMIGFGFLILTAYVPAEIQPYTIGVAVLFAIIAKLI